MKHVKNGSYFKPKVKIKKQEIGLLEKKLVFS